MSHEAAPGEQAVPVTDEHSLAVEVIFRFVVDGATRRRTLRRKMTGIAGSSPADSVIDAVVVRIPGRGV